MTKPGSADDRKPAAPFSLRLTFEERARLEQDAGDMPLGAYIRVRLLADEAAPRPKRRARPSPDRQALAAVLGALGKSRLSSNLNQLAKAVHTGALLVTPDVAEDLAGACADVRIMRASLIRALGLGEGPEP